MYIRKTRGKSHFALRNLKVTAIQDIIFLQQIAGRQSHNTQVTMSLIGACDLWLAREDRIAESIARKWPSICQINSHCEVINTILSLVSLR